MYTLCTVEDQCECTKSDHSAVRKSWKKISRESSKAEKVQLLGSVSYGISMHNASLAAQIQSEIGNLFGTDMTAAGELFDEWTGKIIILYQKEDKLKAYIRRTARNNQELVRLMFGNAPTVAKAFVE